MNSETENDIMESTIFTGDGKMDSTGASGAISRKDIDRMEAHAKLYILNM